VSLFAELRRRNVFRVAVGYVIVAWLVIEVASVLGPALRLPDSATTFVAFVLILGFPIALVLSWAYELTPGGMKKTKSVPISESVTQVTGRKLNFAIIAALALALGIVVLDNYVLDNTGPFAGAEIDPASLEPAPDDAESVAAVTDQQPAPAVLPNSVAVLPLENLSPDPNNAYFAAGMHEEILNHLAKLRNLNVISRTSMVRYADSDLSIPEIAAELSVQTVMEGSVRYANDRVLVTIQLIDPATDAHLWSESYNRDLSDVFAIQADIAMNVANSLRAEFSPAEQARIEQIPTESPEAYALYLRGITAAFDAADSSAFLELRWADDLDRAIALDPDFALAHAAKAYLYSYVLTGNVAAQQEQFEQVAQEHAERALALDPTQGRAHAALAFVHQAHWRWAEAEQEFARALELSPNDSNVLLSYSRFIRYRGDLDEAMRSAQRASQLDPTNFEIHYQLGIVNRYARNLDAAVESFRMTLLLAPSSANSHAQLGYTEADRGNWEIAERELRTAEQLYGDAINTIRLPQLAAAYAQMGRRDEVERIFEALEERARVSSVTEAVWASAYLSMGNNDEALRRLQLAVDSEEPDLVTLGQIKQNAFGNPVLEEPRFQALRDRIGT